ncbi:MAG: EamA family transporter RarD [Rubrivivax sp.]|nr:EamA family transporter RarD [Rubrivivax sp.]
MHTGLVYALLAFGSWGLFPLYFALVAQVPPLEVVLHRSVWSLLLVLGVLAWQRRWAWLGETLRQPKRVALFATSALLLASNWLVYVMAVQTGHVAEASLGYFINPLVNVLLGVLVLHERLRPLQWLSVAVAAAGVLWLTWQGGRLPWIALVLAGSFGVYGLLRKIAPLGALEGLALENLLLAPLAVPVLLWWSFLHDGVLATGPGSLIALLLLSGPLTALPLLWFAGAARRLKLATLGLVQYIAPTLQLMLAVWVFHEPFDSVRLVGFVMIWSALALVSADALGWRPGVRRPVDAVPPG